MRCGSSCRCQPLGQHTRKRACARPVHRWHELLGHVRIQTRAVRRRRRLLQRILEGRTLLLRRVSHQERVKRKRQATLRAFSLQTRLGIGCRHDLRRTEAARSCASGLLSQVFSPMPVLVLWSSEKALGSDGRFRGQGSLRGIRRFRLSFDTHSLPR